MKKILWFSLYVVPSLLLAACNSNSLGATAPANSTAVPYPVSGPTATLRKDLYPVNTPGAAPAPTGEVTPFHLDPLFEGMTEVKGTGPAGLPINLLDVTFMGDLLSQTIIGTDGAFVFQVAALEKNHRVGIALGDLTGTQWKPEDFYYPAYQGAGAMLVPQVGFFYDTVMVQEK